MERTAIAVVYGKQLPGRVPPVIYDSSRFEAFPVCAGNDLLETFQKNRIDLAVLNSDGATDCEELFGAASAIRLAYQQMPLLLITSTGSEDLAVSALRAGIDEYIRRPVSREQFAAAVRECLRRSRSRLEFRASAAADNSGDLVGPGPAMRDVRTYLKKVAATDTSVLISGETGTGKELAARFIHQQSGRRARPLINVNCAAIPDGLLESELFGYERGAFTGAHSTTDGKLRAAEGGTLFLDEIGDMSPYAQAKILRAIENREIQRLGGSKPIPVNIRIVAATNRELEPLVEKGDFRGDLYFRLNVARIHLPALRERPEDIPSLLAHYLDQMNRRYGRQVSGFTEEALECLVAHHWPGNVRELKNVLEAVFIDISSSQVAVGDFPAQFRSRCETGLAQHSDERSRLIRALLSTNWNKSLAADKLHWSRMTLYRKMARYNVQQAEKPARVAVARLSDAARIA